MSEYLHSNILFLVSLLFVALLNSTPTYLLNFEFFYHSSLFAFYTYMLSIHNNLSAGAHKMLQVLNVTGTYVIIMLIYRCLLTTCKWQGSCVIANNARKTAKAIILSKAIISKFMM